MNRRNAFLVETIPMGMDSIEGSKEIFHRDWESEYAYPF